MLKKTKCVLHVVTMLVLSEVVAAEIIQVELRSNKDEYICGEPVLLRTIVSNFSGMKFVGNIPHYYTWGSFTIYIACGDDDFADILSRERPRSIQGMIAMPQQFDRFYDRQMLPKTLLNGQQAERLDMLIFPKPGDYKLKAALRDRDGKVGESEPIQIRILPLQEKYDSISQLGDPNFLINLGSSIFYAHHMEKFSSWL